MTSLLGRTSARRWSTTTTFYLPWAASALSTGLYAAWMCSLVASRQDNALVAVVGAEAGGQDGGDGSRQAVGRTASRRKFIADWTVVRPEKFQKPGRLVALGRHLAQDEPSHRLLQGLKHIKKTQALDPGQGWKPGNVQAIHEALCLASLDGFSGNGSNTVSHVWSRIFTGIIHELIRKDRSPIAFDFMVQCEEAGYLIRSRSKRIAVRELVNHSDRLEGKQGILEQERIVRLITRHILHNAKMPRIEKSLEHCSKLLGQIPDARFARYIWNQWRGVLPLATLTRPGHILLRRTRWQTEFEGLQRLIIRELKEVESSSKALARQVYLYSSRGDYESIVQALEGEDVVPAKELYTSCIIAAGRKGYARLALNLFKNAIATESQGRLVDKHGSVTSIDIGLCTAVIRSLLMRGNRKESWKIVLWTRERRLKGDQAWYKALLSRDGQYQSWASASLAPKLKHLIGAYGWSKPSSMEEKMGGTSCSPDSSTLFSPPAPGWTGKKMSLCASDAEIDLILDYAHQDGVDIGTVARVRGMIHV